MVDVDEQSFISSILLTDLPLEDAWRETISSQGGPGSKESNLGSWFLSRYLQELTLSS
jgi:hypothetical protein